ncbi:hypothetical protein KR093_002778, partial [Drosophila rubida]
EAVAIRFTNVFCKSSNKTRYVVNTCRLRAIKRNKYIFNYDATIIYELCDVKVNVQLVKRANGYKPWLYNLTIDACEFLRKRNNPIIKLIYNIFKDYSNLNHSCPYNGPVLIDGLYLQPGAIRVPMPTGEYGVMTTWIFDSTMKTYANVYFEFIED